MKKRDKKTYKRRGKNNSIPKRFDKNSWLLGFIFVILVPLMFIAISGGPFEKSRSDELSGEFSSLIGMSGVDIIRVTTLNPEGSGSISEAFNTQGPRIVVFEVGGIIDLRGILNPDKNLEIFEPDMLVAGETAPYPGITIIGGGVSVQASNVELRNFRIRTGDYSGGPPAVSASALTIIAKDELNKPINIQEIIIQNMSLSWAAGDIVQVETYNGSERGSIKNVLIQNNLISEALLGPANRGHGLLISENIKEIIVRDNLFIHTNKQNPWFSSNTTGLVINNVIFNSRLDFMDLVVVEDNKPSDLSIIGNIAIAGPATGSYKPFLGVYRKVEHSSNVYLENNPFYEYKIGEDMIYIGKDWEVSCKNETNCSTFEAQGGACSNSCSFPDKCKDRCRDSSGRDIAASSALTWIPVSNLNIQPTSTLPEVESLISRLLENVGARPLESNAIDIKIKNYLRNATKGGSEIGSLPNTFSDVEGFPVFTGTSRDIECTDLTQDSDCDDGNACTDDICYANLTCHNVQDNTNTCNDSISCTTQYCFNGSCITNTTPSNCSCISNSDCEDDNVCTTDRCINSECKNVNNILNCSDSDSSTINDVCFRGECSGERICNNNNNCESNFGENCTNCPNDCVCGIDDEENDDDNNTTSQTTQDSANVLGEWFDKGITKFADNAGYYTVIGILIAIIFATLIFFIHYLRRKREGKVIEETKPRIIGGSASPVSRSVPRPPLRPGPRRMPRRRYPPKRYRKF
jgi:hypothetical protein